MNKQVGYLVGGVALVLLGAFLPREWYDALPKIRGQLPSPPVKGVTLLQIAFVIEGLMLIWLSTRRWRFVRLSAHERLPQTAAPEEEQDLKTSTSVCLLAVITAGALALRCAHLSADLWLDEINLVQFYSKMSVLHIITSYVSFNNHPLNTLLVKLAIAFFGEQEWAVRLPAMFFGVATIPAIYWVSRLALSRRGSLCVATLMAVSYHHIFFSQNARGYTGYLLFSVLSSGLLVKGLQEDRTRTWVLYVLTMLLNFASLILSIFVFAAHLLVAATALFLVKRKGQSPLPLARRLAAVFAVTGVLVLNLYVTMVPQIYETYKSTYRGPAASVSESSVELQQFEGGPSAGLRAHPLLQQWERGLSAGFGGNLLLGLVPFMLVAATGFFALLRRQWALTLALILPGFFSAVILLVNFAPRFFLLWLPLAMLAAVQGIYSLVALLTRSLGVRVQLFAPRIALILVLVGVAISLFSLKRYYLVPKQSYRASLHYIETQRQPGDPIIAIYLSEFGYRFYGKGFGLKENEDWFPVRSVESLDSVLRKNPGHPSIVVTTFPHALRTTYPDLLKRILEGWTLDRTFPTTVMGGEISVWKPRPGDRELGSNRN